MSESQKRAAASRHSSRTRPSGKGEKPASGPQARQIETVAKRTAKEEKTRQERNLTGKHLHGKAKVLESKVAFAGKVFSVTSDRVEEPGGVTATRDVIRHNGSVIVLAIDASKSARNPTVLIERQYRYAAGRFMLELPAGRIEPGEKPLAAAKRELIEETGFRARKWTRLTRYFASPGFLTEQMLVYLAEDIYPGKAEPEDDEKIELLHIPLRELLVDIAEGRIVDGKTMLSVLLYARTRLGVKLS